MAPVSIVISIGNTMNCARRMPRFFREKAASASSLGFLMRGGEASCLIRHFAHADPAAPHSAQSP
jgi:hypothetical protein